MAIVGLQFENMEVNENARELEVCIVVHTPETDCPITFPFEVNIFTTSDTAGKTLA